MTTSLYGPTGSSGTVSSSNLTTLYSGGTGTVPGNNLVVPGVLVVNGCSILTNCTSFNLLPTTATSINFGNEATTLSIGAATGTTTVNNLLAAPGADFGNITIAVADDNTITTTTGDLKITAVSGSTVTLSTDSATGPVYAIRSTTSTNTGTRALTLRADSTGTPAVGFGTSLEYEVESAPGTFKRASFINTTMTDDTVSSENFDMSFGLMQNGATVSERFRIFSNGGIRSRLVTSNTNTVTAQALLRAESTGTPAVGFGNNITYQLEDTTNNVIDTAYLATRYTDVTAGAEKVNFRVILKDGGVSPTQRLAIDSSGDQLITGSQTSATAVGVGGQVATDDFWHIGGYAEGGVSNAGALEIAIANDGTEPIYVRQYSGGSTSGNAWPWGNTILRTLTLLDAAGDTTLPGTLTAANIVVPSNGYINMENNYLIDSSSLTTSTTAANQVVANMNATVTRSAKFVIQITSGTAYQTVEILGIHDGTTATFTTYGDVRTGANLATFDMDVSGGFFRLLTTPVNAVTTYRTAITRMNV